MIPIHRCFAINVDFSLMFETVTLATSCGERLLLQLHFEAQAL